MKRLVILLALLGVGALLMSCSKSDDDELVTCNKVTHKEARPKSSARLCSRLECLYDFYINGELVSEQTYNELKHGDCI